MKVLFTSQTYFVGRGVSELFDTMVVSLTTDRANLYDEKTGIFTNWDQINDENGSWERPAYIEFYEHDGTPMIAQGTGIAVSGHGSRGYDQKSIKLIASKQYDMEHPVFDYDFFDTDMAGNAKGQSYNRLVLRNGGSDHEGTMIKWNVVSRLEKKPELSVRAQDQACFLLMEHIMVLFSFRRSIVDIM